MDGDFDVIPLLLLFDFVEGVIRLFVQLLAEIKEMITTNHQFVSI